MSLSLALLLACIIIQLLDVATTVYGLHHGADEANMLPGFLFNTLGFWPATILLKLIAVGICYAAYRYVTNGYWFIGVFDLLGLAVLVNNWRVIRAG